MEWDWNVVASVTPSLLKGLIVTVQATIVGAVLAYVLGLVIAILKMSGNKAVAFITYWSSEFIRRTPLLVQLYFLFYVLPDFGIFLSPFVAGVIGLGLHFSTYTSEVYRAGIENVPKGQWEAAQSLALNFGEQLRYIIFPQASRIAIAPTVGFLVQVVKGTALASVIGFVELTKAGTMITNATFKPFVVYSCVAVLYFLICYPISLYARSLEGKFHVQR